MTKVRHALTNAEYYAEGPDSVRVVDRDKWGRFDRYGAWLEGELMQCDPQLCI
jgi:MarR-like DNA-binding transcriptional regulator SgrR of sgrS sRNA